MGEIELVEPPCPEQAFVDRVLRSTAPSQCRRRFWLNRVALWLYRCQLSLSFFFSSFRYFYGIPKKTLTRFPTCARVLLS